MVGGEEIRLLTEGCYYLLRISKCIIYIPVYSMIAIQDNLPVDCTVGVDVGFTVGELVEEDSGSSAQER